MKLVVMQIVRLLAALLLLYALLLGLSWLIVPEAGVGQRLDAGRAGASLFLTEPKYVFMARSQLDTQTDKLLLLGASNMLVGFKQAQVQAAVHAMQPQLEVHNLSVGGSNVTQLSQIVDLVNEVQGPDARRRNTWVIGLWYGLFADDRVRWYTPDRHAGDTDIDIERYRYGFYRRTKAGAVPVLASQYLRLGVTLVHPYLVLDRAVRDLTHWLRQGMSGKPAAITNDERNAMVIDQAARLKYLAFWRGYMGDRPTLGEAPYQVLQRMIDGILADGGRVVLVDMPIPSWHADGSVLAADYRRHTDALLDTLEGRAGVTVLRMSHIAADDDFSDEVHPKPRVTAAWAQRLVAGLSVPPLAAASTR